MLIDGNVEAVAVLGMIDGVRVRTSDLGTSAEDCYWVIRTHCLYTAPLDYEIPLLDIISVRHLRTQVKRDRDNLD